MLTNWHGYHGNLVSIVTDMITIPNVCTYKFDRLTSLYSSLLNIKLRYFGVTKHCGNRGDWKVILPVAMHILLSYYSFALTINALQFFPFNSNHTFIL